MTWTQLYCVLFGHKPGNINVQAFHIESRCHRCRSKLMLDSGFGWSRMDE